MKLTKQGPKNAVAAARRVVKQISAGENILVDLVKKEERRSTCNACDHNVNGQCEQCECLITLKTMLTTETCPIGKW